MLGPVSIAPRTYKQARPGPEEPTRRPRDHEPPPAILMWMVGLGSLFRRLAASGALGHEPKPIPRWEEEREVMRATAKGFKETAFSHVHAKNCTSSVVVMHAS